MGIIGAILGDIAGSNYEYAIPSYLDRKQCELFTSKDFFTDDTILSIATKYAIDNGISFEKAYDRFGNEYPNSGYGCSFQTWLESKNKTPYNSYGNGSAMRVSYIGSYFNEPNKVNLYARKSAKCTHNHPEGMKGAVVTAMCVWMAKEGCTKEEILNYTVNQYPSSQYEFGADRPLEEYQDTYQYNVTCQGTVPAAIRCFYESSDYKSFIRNCFSLKQPDLDTICAIGGGIAEEYYKETGFDNDSILRTYLDSNLYNIIISGCKSGA